MVCLEHGTKGGAIVSTETTKFHIGDRARTRAPNDAEVIRKYPRTEAGWISETKKLTGNPVGRIKNAIAMMSSAEQRRMAKKIAAGKMRPGYVPAELGYWLANEIKREATVRTKDGTMYSRIRSPRGT